MAQFSDKGGRPWTIALDVNTLRRVRERLSINLADCIVIGRNAEDDQPLMRRLARDPVLLVDLVYVLCEPQCKERGVSDDDFAAIFDGPSIETASLALVEALDDFFQNPASQLVLRTAARVNQHREAAKIPAADLDAMIDQALDAMVANLTGDSSSLAPDSPGSTPDHAPSGN